MSGPDELELPGESELGALTARVVAIWASVLALPGIGPDSNLLDLGAASLAAVRIQSRIRTELGKDVDLIDMLDNPTPRELAAVVAAAEPWTGPEAWHNLKWQDESAPAETQG